MAQVVDERGVIRQNGPQLVNISEELNTKKEELLRLREELYAELEKCMGGPEESNKIWYGPRAQGCKGEAKKKETDFTAMETALADLATKVNGDATSWGVHENSKY